MKTALTLALHLTLLGAAVTTSACKVPQGSTAALAADGDLAPEQERSWFYRSVRFHPRKQEALLCRTSCPIPADGDDTTSPEFAKRCDARGALGVMVESPMMSGPFGAVEFVDWLGELSDKRDPALWRQWKGGGDSYFRDGMKDLWSEQAKIQTYRCDEYVKQWQEGRRDPNPIKYLGPEPVDFAGRGFYLKWVSVDVGKQTDDWDSDLELVAGFTRVSLKTERLGPILQFGVDPLVMQAGSDKTKVNRRPVFVSDQDTVRRSTGYFSWEEESVTAVGPFKIVIMITEMDVTGGSVVSRGDFEVAKLHYGQVVQTVGGVAGWFEVIDPAAE